MAVLHLAGIELHCVPCMLCGILHVRNGPTVFQPLLSSRFFAANVFSASLNISLSLFSLCRGGKGVKVWNLEWCFGGTQTCSIALFKHYDRQSSVRHPTCNLVLPCIARVTSVMQQGLGRATERAPMQRIH